MGVSSSAGLTQPPPRGGCTGGNLSRTVWGGGFSISRLRGDGRAVGRGGTGYITGMEWGWGAGAPLPRFYELPSRAWSALARAAWVSPRLHFPGVASGGYWLQSHLSSCPKIFSSRYMSLIHAG